MNDELRARAIEILADCEHASWARWQRWMHDQCERLHVDGSLTIPPYLVGRWEEQIDTQYTDLPEHSKESDRKEARLALDALEAAGIVLGEKV